MRIKLASLVSRVAIDACAKRVDVGEVSHHFGLGSHTV